MVSNRKWKGWYFTCAWPAKRAHKLPPSLHTFISLALWSYSKGARGLSVLPQELRIFTENSISLKPYWRQWGSRYTIRAGRNSPDKEFRYLRTVRVTAAVYWGFHSKHTPLLLTFQHRAGVRPYTSSYDFAESCVFIKQSLPPAMLHRCYAAAPLLPKLRGHFAEFLQYGSIKTLVYSTSSPVSV